MLINLFAKPDASATVINSTSKTLTANNTTVSVPLFRVTGDVLVKRLWGVVTTVIGANHTGGYFRLNDQTAQVNITLNTGGATLSALPAGTKIVKTGLATAVATVTSSATGAIAEPALANGLIASEFAVLKKSGANTDIEYTYSTTDAPTSGAIQFFIEWQGRSADAAVTPQ